MVTFLRWCLGEPGELVEVREVARGGISRQRRAGRRWTHRAPAPELDAAVLRPEQQRRSQIVGRRATDMHGVRGAGDVQRHLIRGALLHRRGGRRCRHERAERRVDLVGQPLHVGRERGRAQVHGHPRRPVDADVEARPAGRDERLERGERGGGIGAERPSRLREGTRERCRAGALREREVDQRRVLRDERGRERRRRRVHREVVEALAGDLAAALLVGHAQAERLTGIRAAVVDLQPDAVAPRALGLRRRVEDDAVVGPAAEIDGRRGRPVCQPHDVAVRPAVGVELVEACAELALRVCGTERADEIRAAQAADGAIDRTLGGPAEERRDRGRDAGDRTNAARSFLYVDTRIAHLRHANSSSEMSRARRRGDDEVTLPVLRRHGCAARETVNGRRWRVALVNQRAHRASPSPVSRKYRLVPNLAPACTGVQPR